MPLNMPVGDTDNISFGPARVYMDAWTAGTISGGVTTDVGYIGEDGVTIELTSEKRNITQGNPQLVEYSFVQTQSVMINFTSIQWDFDNFVFALGAGVTTSGATSTFAFGGDPINILTAIHIEHEMAVTGNTLNIYAWKCQSESGFSLPLGQDEHQFEFSFTVLRADTDWENNSLPPEQQLLKLERVS